MTDRQKQVDRYLTVTNLGTAAVLLSFPLFLPIGGQDTDWIEQLDSPMLFLLFFGMLAVILTETFAVFFVFLRRKTDEYTLSMWHTGTSFAFFAAMIWLIVAPWIEATFVGIEVYELASADPELDVEAHDVTKEWGFENGVVNTLATPIILSAFFIGMQVKRFKGGL